MTDTEPRQRPPETDRGPLYGFSGFAKKIREITGKPMSTDTIRSYRRKGITPVADVQVGGHLPAVRTRVLDDGTEVIDVETIPCWPGVRYAKEGEKIDCETYLWYEDTIIEWQAKRRGKKTKEGVAAGAADRDLRFPADVKDTWWKYAERRELTPEELARDVEDRRRAREVAEEERALAQAEKDRARVERGAVRELVREQREKLRQAQVEERAAAKAERERLRDERARAVTEAKAERERAKAEREQAVAAAKVERERVAEEARIRREAEAVAKAERKAAREEARLLKLAAKADASS